MARGDHLISDDLRDVPMLPHTFCHIPGTGLKGEEKLWDEGITSWEEWLEMKDHPGAGRRDREMAEHLYASVGALEDGRVGYFAEGLPASEIWRVFPEFRSRTAYVDIETTGLSADYGAHITTIALYDGREVKHYVHGENLRQFEDDIFDYDLLVTYNGKCFDVPFIERYFRIRLTHAHIDLRYVLRSVGVTGGLKGCEAQLGIERGELEGVDGYFAVLLWYDYINGGNPLALDTLLAYNIQDTVNMERLMVTAYNMKIEETPFGDRRRLRDPSVPENPFRADEETIVKLREKHYGTGVSSRSMW
jgi:uncharacterized protein YprB with RNaseH-like and TPR domain